MNSQTAGAEVHVPFGGIKSSGFGPHEQGRAAIEFYTEVVTVYVDPEPVDDGSWSRARSAASAPGPVPCWPRRASRSSASISATTTGGSGSRAQRAFRSSGATSATGPRSAGCSTSDEITHVVHLAALLIPLIKRDPPYGTAVNVGGTVNVLDAAKTRGIRVAYAELGGGLLAPRRRRPPVANDAPGHPTTFYGVHKQACEGLARIFWDEERVPSVGIRPFIVYGPGRDVGLTASPSLAMAAAARGEPAAIAFGGRTQLQFAPDTARVFVAAARAAGDGARVFHLGGPAVTLAEIAVAIEDATGLPVEVDEDHAAAVSRGVRRERARRGARRDQVDAARGGRPADDRPAARRSGLNEASTRTSAAPAPTSVQSTAPKPPARSRIAPSSSGEAAESV